MNYNKPTKTTLTNILDNFFYDHDIEKEDIASLISELSDAKDAQYYPRATNQTDAWYQIEKLLATLQEVIEFAYAPEELRDYAGPE